jgi:hypothetical protein
MPLKLTDAVQDKAHHEFIEENDAGERQVDEEKTSVV